MQNDLQSQIESLKQQLESLKAEYYLNNFTGSQDYNKYVRFNSRLKVPHYASAPATCEVGEIIEVGGELLICSATNTFTVVGTQT
jgi:transposase